MPLWSGDNGRMIGYRGVRVIVRAFVLIQTESGKTGQAAQEVGAIQGVSSAVVVTGPYDIIAVVQAASIDSLGKMVVSRIQGVKGIPHPDVSGRTHLTGRGSASAVAAGSRGRASGGSLTGLLRLPVQALARSSGS